MGNFLWGVIMGMVIGSLIGYVLWADIILGHRRR